MIGDFLFGYTLFPEFSSVQPMHLLRYIYSYQLETFSHNKCTNFKWFIFMPYELGNFPNCRVQNEMKQFLAKIVEMMKEEHLFASQGGPIILAQVLFFHRLPTSPRNAMSCLGLLYLISYFLSDRLKMNMEMSKGHMELAENYMSNGLQKLLSVLIQLYLG